MTDDIFWDDSKDLAVLTEMSGASPDAVRRRAVHLAAEMVAHQRDGGTILLIHGRRSPWRQRRREKLRFTF